MIAAGVILIAAVAATVLQQQSSNLILLVAVVVAGAVAWRSKRGDFYKSLAEERGAENEQLRNERDELRQLTDITPIVKAIEKMTVALERHAAVTDAVFEKVGDMNGSLRATATAMQALGDRLILDEAARALLAEASTTKERRTL